MLVIRSLWMKRIALVTTMLLVTGLAQATPLLNGSFELTNATVTSQFPNVSISNWTNGGTNGDAIVLPSWFSAGFLFPGVTFDGPVTASSPDGGNFVFSDGNFMNSAITQNIIGLTPSATYALTFYQALAQDKEIFTVPGSVTGYWNVSLGASSLRSPVMFANGSISGPGSAVWSPWKQQTMLFTATSATQLLSFLSVGTGDPPLVLLDGVKLTKVPEPTTLWLVCGAGLALGRFYRQTRWKQLTGHA